MTDDNIDRLICSAAKLEDEAHSGPDWSRVVEASGMSSADAEALFSQHDGRNLRTYLDVSPPGPNGLRRWRLTQSGISKADQLRRSRSCP